MKKRLGLFLFFAYCGFLLWLTVFSRQTRLGDRVFKWELFWAYRAWIAGESFGKTESIQNINNILVFIPFGVLFPIKRWRWLLIVAILFSSTIEVVQYGLNLGWCEIDDVICNVLGAAAGFGIWIWLKGKIDATGEKTWFL